MNDIVATITILFIAGVGYVIIYFFRVLPKKNNLLAIGCSYGLGIGLTTIQMYIYSRSHIPWSLYSIWGPWVILVGFFILFKRSRIQFPGWKLSKLSKKEIALLLGILLACSYTIFEALIRPVSAWDSWVTWLLKSKVFFLDGGIAPDVLVYVRVNYPLVINLLGSLIYLMIGNVDDTAVLLTSSAFYLFTALMLFAALRKKFSLRYSLLFTFFLVSTQNFVRHGGRYEAGLADLPLGYYTFCSSILLLEYLKESKGKVFILLNVFLGITGLIKYEGIPIGIVIELIALYHIYTHKLYHHIPLILLWIIPIVDWDIYQKIHNPKDTYFSSHVFETSIAKTINALWGTGKELINVKSWNLLWIIYFFVLFIPKKMKNKEFIILNIIITSQLAIYLFLYLFTVGNNPESSIERLLMHVAPVAFYVIAVYTKPLFETDFGIIKLNDKKAKKSKKN